MYVLILSKSKKQVAGAALDLDFLFNLKIANKARFVYYVLYCYNTSFKQTILLKT